MIKSILFTKGKYGYVNARVERPLRPSIRDIGYRPFVLRDSEKAKARLDEWKAKKKVVMDRYKQELESYKTTRGSYKNPYLAKTLIGRKIQFTNGINVIVGPNGSGKTTIINAIAAFAGVRVDGFPVKIDPFMMDTNFIIQNIQTDNDYDTEIERIVMQNMKNPCKISWDGTPVYYHNFSEKTAQAGNVFGELKGGIIHGAIDEAEWHLNKNRMSGGETTMYVFEKLYNNIKNPVCYDDLLSYDPSSTNRVHCMTFDAQRRFYKKFKNFSVKKPCTLLLDEIDNNFDIATTIEFFTKYLPHLADETGIQIIVVTHSPIVMSESIYNSPKYNIISLDDKFTEVCKNKLAELFTEDKELKNAASVSIN